MLLLKTKTITAPATGKTAIINRRLAIIPVDTRIYAPVSGIVTVHTDRVRKSDSVFSHDIFIYIGFNSIELCGSGIAGHIKSGSYVHSGDLIANADPDLVSTGGYYAHIFVIARPPLKPTIKGGIWTIGGKTQI